MSPDCEAQRSSANALGLRPLACSQRLAAATSHAPACDPPPPPACACALALALLHQQFSVSRPAQPSAPAVDRAPRAEPHRREPGPPPPAPPPPLSSSARSRRSRAVLPRSCPRFVGQTHGTSPSCSPYVLQCLPPPRHDHHPPPRRRWRLRHLSDEPSTDSRQYQGIVAAFPRTALYSPGRRAQACDRSGPAARHQISGSR